MARDYSLFQVISFMLCGTRPEHEDLLMVNRLNPLILGFPWDYFLESIDLTNNLYRVLMVSYWRRGFPTARMTLFTESGLDPSPSSATTMSITSSVVIFSSSSTLYLPVLPSPRHAKRRVLSTRICLIIPTILETEV